jgi:hypothetical protein
LSTRAWCSGGGDGNHAWGPHSTIGGGLYNQANSNFATVGGGYKNLAGDFGATVVGGEDNVASAIGSTVAGGTYNTAGAKHATVLGGVDNKLSAQCSTAIGTNNMAAAGHDGSMLFNAASCNGTMVPRQGGSIGSDFMDWTSWTSVANGLPGVTLDEVFTGLHSLSTFQKSNVSPSKIFSVSEC